MNIGGWIVFSCWKRFLIYIILIDFIFKRIFKMFCIFEIIFEMFVEFKFMLFFFICRKIFVGLKLLILFRILLWREYVVFCFLLKKWIKWFGKFKWNEFFKILFFKCFMKLWFNNVMCFFNFWLVWGGGEEGDGE